jgi:hypothetical protein
MRGARRTDLEALDDALRLAPTLTAELFRQVMENAGARFSSLHQAGKATRIDRFIESHAWTDAAFVLIELAVPKWTVRRIIRADAAQWHCALSQQPNLPIELDDAAEASHEVLPLAVLRAFVAARRRDAVAPQAVSAIPHIRPASEGFVYCCDNYL